MRRLSFLFIPFLALASCSPELEGPARPIAREQVGAGRGVDVVASRQTVVEFLEAYAHATEDDGARLAELVGGSKLAAWVRWLDVQNDEFPGTIAGQVDLRSVEFVALDTIEGTTAARVDVGASVTFDHDPFDAEPFPLTRILDGPVTLLQVGPADWRIFDLTRDGQSVDAGIRLFRDLSQVRRGVTVHLHSLFMFTPNWQFNVVVENESGDEIQLDLELLGLDVQQGDAAQRQEGVHTANLIAVPSGATVEGLLAFPQQDSAEGPVLSLAYRLAGDGVARFEFALEDVVTPPPTAGAPSPVGSS